MLQKLPQASKLGLWLFLCSLLYQVFLIFPALVIPFGLMDDYHYIQPDGMGFFKNFQIPLQLSYGRPLSALVLGIYSGLVNSLEDLAFIRLTSAICFGIAQGWLALFILRTGNSALPAFVISALAMSGPGFTSIEMWAAAGPFAPGIIFSLLATELIYVTSTKNLYAITKTFLLVFAGAFFMISLLFYPPIALYLPVPLLAVTLFRETNTHNNEESLQIIKNCSIVYVITLTTYFLLMKYVYRGFVDTNLSQYTFGLTSSPIDRLYSFLSEVTPTAANILTWHHPWIPYVVLTVIVFGLSINIFVNISKMISKDVYTIIGALMLLTMTAAHLILAHDDVRAARVLASYQSAIALFFIWGLKQIYQLFSQHNREEWVATTILVTLVAALSTIANITTAASNGFLEFRYVISQLKSITPRTTSLLVYKVSQGTSFIGTTKNNGFNWTTSDKVSTMIPAMVGYALEKNGNKDFWVTGAGFETSSNGRKPLNVAAASPGRLLVSLETSADTLVIDMNSLLLGTHVHNKLIGEFTIATAFSSGFHGPEKAFDLSIAPDDFWEVSMSSPVLIDIDYHTPFTLGSYDLSAGENIERMPKTWRLVASEDKYNWIQLDYQTEFNDWSLNESKSFVTSKSQPYRHYRFIFEKSAQPGIMRIYEIQLNKHIELGRKPTSTDK